MCQKCKPITDGKGKVIGREAGNVMLDGKGHVAGRYISSSNRTVNGSGKNEGVGNQTLRLLKK